MTRIRVNTEDLKTQAKVFESAADAFGKAGDDILAVALALPSCDGQLSGPARTAGYEIQRQSREVQTGLAGDAESLRRTAQAFEAADNAAVGILDAIFFGLKNFLETIKANSDLMERAKKMGLPDGIVLEGDWTDAELQMLIMILNRMQAYLGDKFNAALGLDRKPFVLRKGLDDAYLIPNNYAAVTCYPSDNQISISSISVLTPVLLLHEIGHLVDHNIAGGNGFWSGTHFVQDQYKSLGDGKYQYIGRPEDAPYTMDCPTEDFADSFAYTIMTQDPSLLPGGWDPSLIHGMDAERTQQLAEAIASLESTQPTPVPVPTPPAPSPTPTPTPTP